MVKTSNFYSGNIADVFLKDYFNMITKKCQARCCNGSELACDRKKWTGLYFLKSMPGIYFTDDPAFKGKRRELVAEDYPVYAVKRILIQRIMRHLFPLLTINCLVQMRWWSKPTRQENLITMHRLRSKAPTNTPIQFKDPA